MPILKNARYELFAQAVASGKSADEAYQLAGYSGNESNRCSNAARLSGVERVRLRINEILAASAQKTEVTVESLLAEAAELQREAQRLGQISAATGALVAKAKLAGLWVEKTDNVNRSSDPNMLPDERLADIVAAAAPPPPPAPARRDDERLN